MVIEDFNGRIQSEEWKFLWEYVFAICVNFLRVLQGFDGVEVAKSILGQEDWG